MSDGTVPVKRDTDATSGTLVEEVQAATQKMVEDYSRSYFMWDVWTVVDQRAFKYSSHLDRNEAYSVAGMVRGVVTETPIVADYREMTNGGQESNH